MKELFYFLCLWIVLAGLQYMLPWWSILPGAALIAFAFGLGPGRTAGLAFLAGATLWGLYAGWMDWQNEGVLSTRMGALFGSGGGAELLGVTALLGGVAALLGALTGLFARQLFRPVRSNE